MKGFASDNYAGVLPQIMQALQKVNDAHAVSYGQDEDTTRVRNLFKKIIEADVDVLFVFNGTGANVLSISSAAQSFHSVLCADTSHFYNDESSAPETFTGCRFFPVKTNNEGKLEPSEIEKHIIRKGDIHFAQPKVISITQSTEYGTIYTIPQLKAIGELAHRHGLYFHVDGSRMFNAAAALGCTLKEITTDVGVDILSLGGTKLGMMYGEAVVVFNKQLANDIYYRQKQVMQLASKTRFIAVQFEALLHNELWRKTALHANAMTTMLATELKKIPQINITKPTQANAVFAIFPKEWIVPLQQKFPFYVWNNATNEVRLMCSYDTTIEEVNDFAQEAIKLSMNSR